MQATTTPRLAGNGSATPAIVAVLVAIAIAFGALIGLNLDAIQQPTAVAPAPAFLDGADSRQPTDDMVGTALMAGQHAAANYLDGAVSRLPSDDMVGNALVAVPQPVDALYDGNGTEAGEIINRSLGAGAAVAAGSQFGGTGALYDGDGTLAGEIINNSLAAGAAAAPVFHDGAASRLPSDDMVGTKVFLGPGTSGYTPLFPERAAATPVFQDGAASRLPSDDMVGNKPSISTPVFQDGAASRLPSDDVIGKALNRPTFSDAWKVETETKKGRLRYPPQYDSTDPYGAIAAPGSPSAYDVQVGVSEKADVPYGTLGAPGAMTTYAEQAAESNATDTDWIELRSRFRHK
jgi:hypothetical protein